MNIEETFSSEDYDEFAWLEDTARELGIPFRRPQVRRRWFDVGQGRALSALQWGEADPELVFLHGGSQNAHIWDAVLLLLDAPAIAIDLPGHGRSFRRADGNHGGFQNATLLADLLPRAVPTARNVVGMSLGALTAMRLASARRDWVERVVLVDATPPVDATAVIRAPANHGPLAEQRRRESYASFQEIMDIAIALNPRRGLEGLQRETRFNAERRETGEWAWRYDVTSRRPDHPISRAEMLGLWADIEKIRAPCTLAYAEYSRFVSERNLETLARLAPHATSRLVRDSGHNIQVDQPRVLADILGDVMASPGRSQAPS